MKASSKKRVVKRKPRTRKKQVAVAQTGWMEKIYYAAVKLFTSIKESLGVVGTTLLIGLLFLMVVACPAIMFLLTLATAISRIGGR